MRMAMTDGTGHHDTAANRPKETKDAGPASGGEVRKADEERVRALHDLARKMDKMVLRWVQAKRRPEGGESQ